MFSDYCLLSQGAMGRDYKSPSTLTYKFICGPKESGDLMRLERKKVTLLMMNIDVKTSTISLCTSPLAYH